MPLGRSPNAGDVGFAPDPHLKPGLLDAHPGLANVGVGFQWPLIKEKGHPPQQKPPLKRIEFAEGSLRLPD